MRRNQAGYSLLEMVIVVACLSIMLAIAVPYWFQAARSSYGLKGAARQMIADIRHAKIRSAVYNMPYRVVLSPETNSYRIQRKNIGESKQAWKDVPGSYHVGAGEPGVLPKGIYIESATVSTVQIKPTGNISASTIILTNKKDKKIKITCSMTGRIRMGRIT